MGSLIGRRLPPAAFLGLVAVLLVAAAAAWLARRGVARA
jgi:hypothetical protein